MSRDSEPRDCEAARCPHCEELLQGEGNALDGCGPGREWLCDECYASAMAEDEEAALT